jgi:hypothetical protein
VKKEVEKRREKDRAADHLKVSFSGWFMWFYAQPVLIGRSQ